MVRFVHDEHSVTHRLAATRLPMRISETAAADLGSSMTVGPLTVPLPAGFTPVLEQVRAQLGDSLIALLLFGSCLSSTTRQPDSVPDLLAVVGHLGTALRRLGSGPIARALAGWLPPLTLALRDPAAGGSGRSLAKLNLVELAVAQDAVRELPDLYLAGRLSKPTAWLWHRDAECRAAVEALLHNAATALADLTLRGLAGGAAPVELTTVVDLYIGQSYLAEVRPEGPEKWRALRSSFPDFYDQRVQPLLLGRAAPLGLRALVTTPPAHRPSSPGLLASTASTVLIDERPPNQRRADHQTWARLIRRSRLRTVARWPKMALVYHGWLPYLIGKLRRVWRQRRLPQARPSEPAG